jgi:cell division protein FtsA
MIKIEHGCAIGDLVKNNETLNVAGVGGRIPRVISRTVLTDIVQPRMEEILNLTYQEMEKSDLLNLMATGAVITGGGAMLKGTIDLAEKLWGMPVKLGLPKSMGGLTETVRNPIYSTAVGLTIYGQNFGGGLRLPKKPDGLWEEVRDRIKYFFEKFF